jgi:hypothetical protein
VSSSRALMPVTMDSDLRTLERLADLEARVAAIESRRDLIITPLGSFAGSGTATDSVNYLWRGGRMWLMWWGTAVNLTLGPAIVGSQLVLNGSPAGANSQVQSDGNIYSTWNTEPAFVGLSGSGWTAGQNASIGFTRNGVNTSSWTATALMIEWPQA